MRTSISPLMISFCAIVCALLPASLAAAESTGADASPKVEVKLATGGQRAEQASAGAIPSKSYTFSCRFKRVRVTDADQHYGVRFSGPDGKMALWILLRDNNAFYVSPQKKGENPIGSFKTIDGKNGDWHTLKLVVSGDFIEMDLDGKLIGSVEGETIPAAGKLSFTSFRSDLEIADVTITPKESSAATTAAEKDPAFTLGFEDGLNATVLGKSVAPDNQATFKPTPGVKGNALLIKQKGDSPLYSVDGLFAESGTLALWVRPDWDGEDKLTEEAAGRKGGWPCVINGRNSEGKGILNAFFWHWLRFDLPRQSGDPVTLNRHIKRVITQGSWLHLTLVWNRESWSAIYVDGLPYAYGADWDKEGAQRLGGLNLQAVSKLLLGGNGGAGVLDGAIDEVTLYRRALNDEEVASLYRAVMPLDFVMDSTHFFSDQPANIEFILSPAGEAARPNTGPAPKDNVAAALRLRLLDRAGKEVAASDKGEVTVSGRQAFILAAGSLAPGAYIAAVTVSQNGCAVEKRMNVFSHHPPRAPVAAGGELKTSAAVYERTTSGMAADFLQQGTGHGVSSALGAYVEAGANKGDRVAFEVTFPKVVLNGRPVVLEITWPDDRPRAAGFYLYPPTQTAQHRDRLGGGIQSGAEYPLTKRLQTTRYLFYPGYESYLFELRTMIKGMPAALCSLRVLPVEGDLPRLAINQPASGPGRTLGHLDEDQTFDTNLDRDNIVRLPSWQRSDAVLDRLCEYFDYTGQNALAYPLLRYNSMIFYSLANSCGVGLFPGGYGEVPHTLDYLNRRGTGLSGIVNLYGLPEIKFTPEKKNEYVATGIILRGPGGETLINPVHPQVRAWLLEHIRAVVQRYGKMPGFRGLDLWLGSTSIGFSDFRYGYDDFTVALFCKETNTPMPAFTGEIAAARARSAWLTGDKREAWLAWRAGKLLENLRQIRAILDEVNPALPLYISVGGDPQQGDERNDNALPLQDVPGYYYKEYGLNIAAVHRELANTLVTPIRSTTCHRHNLHWDNRSNAVNENIFTPELLQPFVRDGKSRVCGFPRYFETFVNSLSPKKYNGYFQNADVKPWGRYFLKDLTYSIAATDAQEILLGAQPLGSWGRDAEMREFALAYRALPARPFQSVQGLNDPVTVRYLQTPEGTYVYAASMLWGNSTVSVRLDRAAAATDLSRSAQIPEAQTVRIELKPYELRSFLLKGKVVPLDGTVTVGAEVETAVTDQMARLKAGIAALEKAGTEPTTALGLLADCMQLLTQKKYAALHRVLFSRRLETVLKQSEEAAEGLLQKKVAMIAADHYAVNCGSSEYYRAQNGSLYLPDQPYTTEGKYGYVGNACKWVGRSAENLQGTADTPLFQSEVYDLDGYRFDVRPGRYTVRLFLRIGYEPKFKTGAFVFTVKAGDKTLLRDFDVYTAQKGRADQVVMQELRGVEVTGDSLELSFVAKNPEDGSIRFLNAAEVIPE